MNLTIKMKISVNDCEIIKQEKINHPKDRLILGIYKPLFFKTDFYIICCNRNDKMMNTLDYTKFAANIESSLKIYDDMKKEIKKDLEV